MIELIAAAAENGVIGCCNKLLWHIPEDFAFFKRTTMGSPVIMGRKTWDSIGRALPGRLNIVVSRNSSFGAPGAAMARSIAEALSRAEGEGASRIFIIGGAQIYQQVMPYAERIWLTRIGGRFEGDAFFPTIPRSRFRRTVFCSLFPTERRPWRVDFERWDLRNC